MLIPKYVIENLVEQVHYVASANSTDNLEEVLSELQELSTLTDLITGFIKKEIEINGN